MFRPKRPREPNFNNVLGHQAKGNKTLVAKMGDLVLFIRRKSEGEVFGLARSFL